ncbi:circadian clock protein KaiC [Halopolyspora algeriensis]|uniref:non-specific serine/threonine protein kinase n=1 Tax=Halopolyspora algeriensis TaxID=1500506 RepID=A0A368VYJ7_9ACTN|nr:ATPase domain-containing protein [Halopolyspora algeriensis]RCW45902.1 circadian clock protein KaiC [Halopolyspora algeriensis]TQM55316.1 circadian clock protein KaiC [Halopolyspora algeriensis]
MIDRISTGNARLDQVTGGGLPSNAINLVMGLPGTGKTLLAQQCVFSNADPQRPALYLSTASEPFEKILRYVQGLSFFDPALVGNGVVYDELGSTLLSHGVTGVGERVSAFIREYRPGILVIDSFKALSSYATSSIEFRNFLHELAATQSVFPVTTLWLGEYEEGEMATAPEFAVADSILELSSHRFQKRSSRSMQVHKLRGGDFFSGRHTYGLSREGLEVYPRFTDVGDHHAYLRERERASSGIQALDDMLNEGYRVGSSTLMAGPTGIGKTLMGLHFLFGGVRQGDHGVMATFQEDPTQLEQVLHGFGWSFNTEGITLKYRPPVEINLDEWVYDILDTLERTGARRLFIDSLNDLESVAEDPSRFDESLYSLLHRCSRNNVSVMMSYEVRHLFGVTSLTDRAASNLADNVVLLQYVPTESAMYRSVTVLKTRGSTHDLRVRFFEVASRGIVLTDDPSDPGSTPS